MSKNKILNEYLKLLSEKKSKVKIPIKKGALGLHLDSPEASYRSQLKNGNKSWDKMSKEIETLAIYNSKKHPETAAKARKLQKSLSAWVKSMRVKNPNFAR